MRDINFKKKKILTLLAGGAVLLFARNPNQYFRTIRSISKELSKIREAELKKQIRELYESQLVSLHENNDDTVSVMLSDRGKLKVLKYNLENMSIKKHKWDKKWRLILFDVPENQRAGRDALREKLQQLGFFEYQKSAFVYPYECKNEIDFISEIFEIKPFVRYAVVESFDNSLHLEKFFHLL